MSRSTSGPSGSRMAQSSTSTAAMPRVLAANQRWRIRKRARSERPGTESSATSAAGSERGGLDAIDGLVGQGRLQPEPVVAVGRQADEVGPLADGGEAGVPQHLHRGVRPRSAQIELHRLGRAGEVVDRDHRLALVLAHVGEHALVGGPEEGERAAAEDARLLAHRDEPLHPVEQGGRGALLGLRVDGLVAVDGVHDQGQVEAGGVRAGEARVAVARPLHRGADPVAVAQVHAGHEREVEGHVELVAIPEIGADVGGPLVGLGQENAPLVLGVDVTADLPQELVGLRQVLAVGPLALDEIGDRVAAEAVEALVQPEAHDVEQLAADLRIVEVEIRLVVEEAMPVVGLRHRIPGPVGVLGVHEDDAGVPVPLVGVAPDVVIAVRRVGRAAGGLEPRVLVRRVVDHQIRDDPHAVAVGGLEEAVEVGHGAVVRMDRAIVGHVVAVVAQRRAEEGQEPETIHSQLLEMPELAGEPDEVADAVVVAVLEGADVELVEDGVLVPERIAVAHAGLTPRLARCSRRRAERIYRASREFGPSARRRVSGAVAWRGAAGGEPIGYAVAGRGAAGGEPSGYAVAGRGAAGGEPSGYAVAGRGAAGGEPSGYAVAGRGAAGGEPSGYIELLKLLTRSSRNRARGGASGRRGRCARARCEGRVSPYGWPRAPAAGRRRAARGARRSRRGRCRSRRAGSGARPRGWRRGPG